MRRRKYDAGGILHFHAIDFWPSVTMAALDYFRKPTRSYFTVQRSFQMVLASVEYNRDTWKLGEDVNLPLWVLNDHWYAIPKATVKWRVVEEGVTAASGEVAIDIEADSSRQIGAVRWTPSRAGKVELRTQVLNGQGKEVSENIYDFEVK
jgi:beta-mannosidase